MRLAKLIYVAEDQQPKGKQGYETWYYDIKEVDRKLSYFLVRQSSLVCDVGGCLGYDVLEFVKQGAFVIDVDINKSVLKYAKKQAQKFKKNAGLNLINASATKLPFRNETLDLVTCFSVLDHLPDKDSVYQAICEFSRVVRESGHVAVTVPNKLFLMGTVSMKLKNLTQPDAFFEQRFTPKELKRILTLSGLTPIMFESKYPTSIGRGILEEHFPRVIKKLPKIMVLLFIGAKLLGCTSNSLRLFGARMGYLCKKNRFAE